MKSIILCLSISLLFANIKANDKDTIQHTIGSCIGESCLDTIETFLFDLKSDTLIFSGNIFANSCGEHFLIYSIDSNIISINRLDTGQLCRCHCLYQFVAEIANCNLDSYQIYLDEYYDNGLDTIINKNQFVNVYYEKTDNELKLYPNPIMSSGILRFNTKDELIESIIIFNVDGKEIMSIDNIKSYDFKYSIEKLNHGLYIYKLKTKNDLYSGKIIIY